MLACVIAAAAIACGSGGDGAGDGAGEDGRGGDGKGDAAGANDPAVAARLQEKPWEIVSRKGETYLPNVFYADPSENEQIMPYAIDGHVQIDRLVYPTLGNPNLYAKSDADDELVVVLRIEDAALSFLSPKVSPVPGSTLSRVELPATGGDGLAFYLVPRGARGVATKLPYALPGDKPPAGVVRIVPSLVFQNATPPDMPERLAARKTLRFVFDRAAMAKVSAGLYDLRYELRKGGALFEPRGPGSGVHEYQYNAVRVFDEEPDEYDVVNVTDTQVSIGSAYDDKTKAHLESLVTYLNGTSDPKVKNAAFISFNGDLHNGGSPGSLRQRTVAGTYAAEAKVTLAALAELPLPIFLTAGNHDGYVSIGQVPSAIRAADTAALESLQEVVEEIQPAWPGFSWASFQTYLDATAKADMLGGFHRDVFTGAFARDVKGQSFRDGWKEVPRERRNMVLYDGFHQWQKTYGPLYTSWRFGKNRYVSLNSYELRQHRRAGWGMYTVNYGGGISDVQMDWVDRELLRARTEGSEVVMLAHHDPRGGHFGKDFGYYFEQLEFRGVSQSAINYLYSTVWTPNVCAAPAWALSRSQEESCVHDGLQEWMRPDEELDCAWDERIEREDGQPTCETTLFDPARGAQAHTYWFSGLELMKRITTNPAVRTVLLGHTHYNQLEVLQAGDEMVPGQLPVDGTTTKELAYREIQNPLRGHAVLQDVVGRREDYAADELPFRELAGRTDRFRALFQAAIPGMDRVLKGTPGAARELVVLRTVSNADLANQTYQGKSALGFAVLHVRKKDDARGFTIPQINGATFYVNASGAFLAASEIAIDRAARLAPRDPSNPVTKSFVW